MAGKTGLGKGLDALFSSAIVEVPTEEKMQTGESIVSLKLIDVEPNKNQPRKIFDEERLDELADSIKEYGIIQPIIVTKQKNYYEIVAGERRWRAAKKAGISEIPAIVRDYTQQKNKEIALIENIQRQDLNPIEKAKGIKELVEKYNMSQQEVAEKMGLSRSTVSNTLRILNLDKRVIDLALEGKLTEGHCRSLLTIDDPEKQYKTALYIIENGDTVRAAEKEIYSKKKVKSTKYNRYEPIYKSIEDDFRNFFGTQVKINAKKRAGTIVIHYGSKDELNNIITKIGSSNVM